MASNSASRNDERVTLRTWLLIGGFSGVGIALLWVSELAYLRDHAGSLAGILDKIGGLFLVSAAVAIGWDLVVKRRFVDEMFAKARLSDDVTGAGLAQVTDSFHSDVDWCGLLTSANKIDMFFAYASTWRIAHQKEFQEVSQNKDVKIRIVLPDTSNSVVCQELARRFSYTEEQLKARVDEAVAFFRDLRDGGQAAVEIWVLPYSPVLTYYRFDNTAVIATYSQQQKRTAVPALVCRGGGSLYAFVRAEFQAMIEGDRPLGRKLE